MKFLSLVIWVTQFGVSAVVPLCFFLWLASRLQNAYGFGIWVFFVCGLVGLLIFVSTVRSCLRTMRKEADSLCAEKETDGSFNDHE